jgi:DNA-binding NtrC family response regulator
MSNKNHRFVAIIDDELDIVELFYDALTGINGIALFKFTNPMLAVEHIKLNKNAYVLIISDLRMPGLNGIDLIKSVKTLNQS